MTISKEKVREIAKKHLILSDSEAEDAFRFVLEILCEELDASRKEEPYATRYHERLEIAEHEVYDIETDVVDALGDEDEVDNDGVYAEFYAERNWDV